MSADSNQLFKEENDRIRQNGSDNEEVCLESLVRELSRLQERKNRLIEQEVVKVQKIQNLENIFRRLKSNKVVNEDITKEVTEIESTINTVESELRLANVLGE